MLIKFFCISVIPAICSRVKDQTSRPLQCQDLSRWRSSSVNAIVLPVDIFRHTMTVEFLARKILSICIRIGGVMDYRVWFFFLTHVLPLNVIGNAVAMGFLARVRQEFLLKTISVFSSIDTLHRQKRSDFVVLFFRLGRIQIWQGAHFG